MEAETRIEMAPPPAAVPEPAPVPAETRTRATGAEVLVVIPTLDEQAHIETCIRSLLDGDDRTADFDIVVADGGSKDQTRAIVERMMTTIPRLRLLDNPLKLQSAAVNRAARTLGKGKTIMVRCDAHAIYPKNYVMQVADSMLRNKVASVATPMDAVGKSCFQKANAYIVDTPLGSGGSAHRGGRTSMFVDHGHHAGFDLATFLRLGGYDEAFSHNEDAEYDRRLTKDGGRIWLDADIRITYIPRATVSSLARQYYRYGKGRARNLRKHGGVPKLRQLIPAAAFLGSVAGLALAPLTPWALVLPGGYLAMLVAASIAVAVWKRSPCGLLAGLASGVMHMSWAVGFLRNWFFGRKGPDPVRSPQATHAE